MPINNAQPTLAITQYVMMNGIYPQSDDSTGGAGDGYFTMGMVRNFAGNFDPGADMFAQGQLLSISQHSALFSLIGVTYGGNGTNNFALPNLSNRLTVSEGFAPGVGTYVSGQVFGSSAFNLTQANLPPSSGGSIVQVANEQPSLATQYIIRINDLYFNDSFGAQGGEIVQFAGNRTPLGYFDCDGRALAISEYPDLFATIGTTYGGDGVTTFNIPDLRGRAAVGTGVLPGGSGVALGQQLGSAGTGIALANMPVAMGGSGQPVSNYGPGLGLNYLIRTSGIFPSRDSGGAPEDDYYLGEIIIYAGSDVPPGFARCDGAVIPINNNTALFSLLGTQYGGNGVNSFALPNFSGRSAVGYNSSLNQVGQQDGIPTFTITMADIPSLYVNGTGAADALYGGDANDAILGNDGDDVLIGNGGADDMNGHAGTDTLNGGAGNDTLRGGGGQDTLSGGEGSDTYYIDAGDETDVINEGAGASGVDRVITTLASYTLAANVENLTGLGLDQSLTGNALNNAIDGTEGNDTLDGGDGDDTLNGNGGNDILNGGLGADILNGGEGDDVLRGGAGADQHNGGNGIDTANYSTSTTRVDASLFSGGGFGDASGDTYNGVENLTGGQAGDILVGNAGANRIEGGSGNDNITGRNGADVLIGGSGIDTLDYRAENGAQGVTVNFVTGMATDSFGDTDTFSEFENVYGTAFVDVMTGDAAFNTLLGDGGNDILDGGTGQDILYGGSGDDILIVDVEDDQIQEFANQGTDEVRSTASSYTLSANVENLTGLLGTGQALIGNELGNVVTGGAGGDTLTGALGDDTLTGGLGSDVAVFSGNRSQYTITQIDTDSVLVVGPDGSDTVNEVETFRFADGDVAFAALIDSTPPAAPTSPNLVAASDTGVSSDDDITNDNTPTVVGAAEIGSTVTIYDTDGTTVLGTGVATSPAGVYSITLSTLSDGVHTLTARATDASNNVSAASAPLSITIDTAAPAAPTITSFSEDTGVAGDFRTADNTPTLTGTAVAGAIVSILRDGVEVGTATADGMGVWTYVSAGLMRGTYAFTAIASDLAGNPSPASAPLSISVISVEATAGADDLEGTIGNDSIDGLAGDDVISGLGGNDILIGSGGADTLNGDEGDDTLAGGAGMDSLYGGSGIDTIDYSLETGSFGVNMTLEGGYGYDSFGNQDLINGVENVIGTIRGDVLGGDAGVNRLDGGLGNDQILSSAGADILIGGEGFDIVYYDRGSIGAVTVNLATGVAIDEWGDTDTISGFEDVIGSGFDDTLIGNADANVLDGRAGADAMTGGAGNDTYVVDNAGDVVTELADEGTDTVQTGLAFFQLGVTAGSLNVENLDATGSLGVGQVLIGTAGANVITGSGYDDTLVGGAGADALYGNGGIDFVDYGLSTAAVTVNLDAFSGQGGDAEGDQIYGVENVTGSYFDDTLIGNGANNSLFGIAGDDVLEGGGGDDILIGGEGSDSLSGGDGADLIYFEAADSFVSGGAGYDVAYVTGGARVEVNLEAASLEYVIDTAGGDDWFQGTFRTEAVTVFAGAGTDVVQGGAGNDVLWGEAGNDTIVGGAGNDVLVGGSGADLMNGGLGRDILYGGAADGSQDLFRFTSTGAANWDYVREFEVGTDKIDLRAIATSFDNISVAVVGGNTNVSISGQLVCVVIGVTNLTDGDFLLGTPLPNADLFKDDQPFVQPAEAEVALIPSHDFDVGVMDFAVRPGHRGPSHALTSDYDWMV